MAAVKGAGGAAPVEIAARWRGGVGWMAGVKGRAVGDGERDLPPVGAIRSRPRGNGHGHVIQGNWKPRDHRIAGAAIGRQRGHSPSRASRWVGAQQEH